jgi:hypothetical protein
LKLTGDLLFSTSLSAAASHLLGALPDRMVTRLTHAVQERHPFVGVASTDALPGSDAMHRRPLAFVPGVTAALVSSLVGVPASADTQIHSADTIQGSAPTPHPGGIGYDPIRNRYIRPACWIIAEGWHGLAPTNGTSGDRDGTPPATINPIPAPFAGTQRQQLIPERRICIRDRLDRRRGVPGSPFRRAVDIRPRPRLRPARRIRKWRERDHLAPQGIPPGSSILGRPSTGSRSPPPPSSR